MNFEMQEDDFVGGGGGGSVCFPDGQSISTYLLCMLAVLNLHRATVSPFALHKTHIFRLIVSESGFSDFKS